jgi:NAD(P)H-flavin reductase
VATGARPNIAYEFEHRGTFVRHEMQYQTYELDNDQLTHVDVASHCKQPAVGPFTSYDQDGHKVSFLGDTHPVFNGSVVKAVASAKKIYPQIMQVLSKKADDGYTEFSQQLTTLLSAHVHSVRRLSKQVVELVIQAPLASRNFLPGQFYRINNYESAAPWVQQTQLQSEALALSPASVDPRKGQLTFLVQENTVSARMVATFKPQQSLTVMGPTGVRMKVQDYPETVLMIGDASSVAFMCSIAKAIKQADGRVFMLMNFADEDVVYYRDQLLAVADHIDWVFANEDWQQKLIDSHEKLLIDLADVDRILVHGNVDLLKSVQVARNVGLKSHLQKEPSCTGSIYGPMQCMLKGVCAQCLQWQIDPKTGERTKAVFSCSWQDQPLEIVDLDNLADRYQQNAMQETLSDLWLDFLYDSNQVERV